MKITLTCTQGIAWYFQGDLSFFPLSSASSPCSACRPAQQQGQDVLARGGSFPCAAPRQSLGGGRERGDVPLRCLLHLCSVLPCPLQVTHWKRSGKELQTLEGRSLQSLKSRELCTCKENCHIPKFFLSILSSMATPAANNRVWIHCLWAAKGHRTICVAFSGKRLPEWNIKCGVQTCKAY